MSEYRELLIGCGYRRNKMMGVPGSTPGMWTGKVVTLDLNTFFQPDLLWNLNVCPWRYMPIQEDGIGPYDGTLTPCQIFPENFFDEIHAYEVLEHLGQQGESTTFFELFNEIWRVLKPNAYLFATVPSRYSAWLWGDPSHRRAILPETLTFLSQQNYIDQCDGPDHQRTPMSDFRGIYHADFAVAGATDNHETFAFGLKAIKPSRRPSKFGAIPDGPMGNLA